MRWLDLESENTFKLSFRWITERVASISSAVVLVVAFTALILPGCDTSNPTRSEKPQQPTPISPASQATAASSTEEHGHREGAHGGIIVSLGQDSYHIEAVFESSGKVRLFTLGKDETRVIDIPVQTLNGFVKTPSDESSTTIEFIAEKQSGDAENRSSQFVGQLPETLIGKHVTCTIPNVSIDGERFRLSFESRTEKHLETMPARVENSKEAELYLTPGGAYTAEDIAANGNILPSLKFAGIESNHDAEPKVGDKICPISETKANPQFTWVIGGRPYQFCCPPCVDEFLRKAKESPESLQPPESFVKQ